MVYIFQVFHSYILLECQRLLTQALVADVVSSQLSIPQYAQLQLLADLQIHLYILHDRQDTTPPQATR